MDDLVLISIKTKYVKQIFNGTKKYEFRKKTIGNDNLNKKIYVYSSKDEKAIIGYIVIDKIIKDSLNNLLIATNNIGNMDIINYFKDCNECYAFHIKDYYIFKKIIKLEQLKSEYNNFTVPQFYRYIKNDNKLYDDLKNRE